MAKKRIDWLKIPSEQTEQSNLTKWAHQHPILKDFYYSIANESKRTIMYAMKLKRTGQRSGVSDINIPYPSHGLHGFWGEMKRRDIEFDDVPPEQIEWLERMIKVGHRGVIAFGWDGMKSAIEDYLNGNVKRTNSDGSFYFGYDATRRDKSFDEKTTIWIYR